MTDKIIRGAGGPPPTPPPRYVAPDTLNSKQFATILDLISEGEIEGFATPSKANLAKGSAAYNNAALKDIFLNDTPILNSSASNTDPQTTDFNFQNVGFTPRFGTSNQPHIAGIESSQSITAVGVIVTNTTPVTRQITNTFVDAVKVTITFPQLQEATDSGDLLGASVDLKIQVQYNGGGFKDEILDTAVGRSADSYQKEFRINLKNIFPVDIRVVRLTADSTTNQKKDAFVWTSFTEIVDDKQDYKNSAYTSLRLDSEQFNSIPKRAFRIRGVKVRIPGAGASNSGTPTVDLQTGRVIYPSGYIFNGTMGAAQWCSCPSLILLDLLTTERYGLGTHITDSNLDLFSFIAASKYANELVDDSFGGQEARFSCNVNIQGSKEAYTLINELAGVMRCFPIWSEGSVTLAQDGPTDPSYLFSLANVGEGGFSYSGSSLKQRHSIINVSYFNMDSREIDYEVVGDDVSGPDALQEDIDRQAKLGIVKKDVKAFACTSRGQARRLGKAVLLSEEQETEVVSFTTSIDAGAIVRPGSVISINDPVRAVERRSGRIKSATTTAITVDNVKDLSTFTGSNKQCSVIMPDGSLETKNIQGQILNGVINLDSALSTTPNINSIWLLQSSTLEPQAFRVITVEEQDGINFAITALKHNYDYVKGESPKYKAIDNMQGITLPARNVSLLNQPKNPPESLQAREIITILNNLAVPKLILSWKPITGVTQYLVQYRFSNTNWTTEIVFRPDLEIINTQAGTYDFRVFSYNAALKLSSTSTNISFNAVGKISLPGDVKNVQVEAISNEFVRIRFDKSTDVDVLHGGNVVIRSTNLTIGATFSDAVTLDEISGNVTEAIVPNIVNGTYLLKFKDDGGRLSNGTASIRVTNSTPKVLPKLLVLTDREDLDSPSFQGTKTNCFFSSQLAGLVLGSADLLDAESDFDAIPNFDLLGAGPVTFNLAEATYDFANTLDLGNKQPLNLIRHFVTQGFYPNDLTDDRTGNVDTWTDFDGNTAIDVNAKLLVATTDSDPDTSTACTYSISGTTITITKSSHGYSVGSFVTVNFTSGTGVDGDYEIKTVPDVNTFTLTSTTSLTTSGNCTYSAEFSQFNPLVNGVFLARGFKFKCEMSTNDPAQSIKINQLGYTAEIESRTETSLGNAGATNGLIASGTSTKSVTFTDSFFTGQSGTSVAANSVLPSIGITIENQSSGDFFVLSNISATGFDIDIKNGSSHVNRNFKYSATGFGRGS